MTDQDVDVQPTGERVEATLDVVPRILMDAEFAEQVRLHNGFPEGLSQEAVALLFLTGRYQWAVALLTQRTDALAREIDGLQK
jgi:hypothetical protein